MTLGGVTLGGVTLGAGSWRRDAAFMGGEGAGDENHPLARGLEREGNALRRRGRAGIEGDPRQNETGVVRRRRQALGSAEFDHQREPRARRVGEAGNAETANLDQPGQFRRRASDAGRDLHPVIGDEDEAAIDQPQGEVGFARPARPKEQHPRAIPRDTTAMNLSSEGHSQTVWRFFAST